MKNHLTDEDLKTLLPTERKKLTIWARDKGLFSANLTVPEMMAFLDEHAFSGWTIHMIKKPHSYWLSMRIRGLLEIVRENGEICDGLFHLVKCLLKYESIEDYAKDVQKKEGELLNLQDA